MSGSSITMICALPFDLPPFIRMDSPFSCTNPLHDGFPSQRSRERCAANFMNSTLKEKRPAAAERIARLRDEGKDVSRFFTNCSRRMSPLQRVKRKRALLRFNVPAIAGFVAITGLWVSEYF